MSGITPAALAPWKKAALARQAAIERRLAAVRDLLSAMALEAPVTGPLLGQLVEADGILHLLEADVRRGLDLKEVPCRCDTPPA